MTAETAVATPRSQSLVGARSHLGGQGQAYQVVGMAGEGIALVAVASSDSPLPYAVADVESDLAGNSTKERFLPLVGQYRSMGPDGPEYEVMSIEGPTHAKIWVVGDEENLSYEIQDILIDPVVYDGK